MPFGASTQIDRKDTYSPLRSLRQLQYPHLALSIIWLWLPETTDKELEESAKLPR